ncbi:MAG: GNAT family N-acetyltransferase [Saprospiraceae bacterium]|nr:GNAT family N-acetyltransferase [Saprospiraceae bacterium]
MNVNIRKTEKKDYPAVLNLIKELALFERAPEKVTNTAELMNEEENHFQSLVAENEEGEIIGMAIFFFAYFTWVGKSLYLDDIVVTEKYRGNKIGTKLLEKVVEFGKKNNCKRIRWQVLNWNEDAIEFYKKYGAKLDGEWINCDMEGF